MDAFELITTISDGATVVRGLIPDPDPTPPPGAEGIVTLFSYIKWGGIILAGLALLIGFAILAWAGLTGRDIGSQFSKILWPMVGAIGIGGGVGIIGTVAGY